LAETIAACLSDVRDPARVRRCHADMIRARVFAIATGYEDCDDLDVLRTDPAMKIACGRAPETGADPMSQPTLSPRKPIRSTPTPSTPSRSPHHRQPGRWPMLGIQTHATS